MSVPRNPCEVISRILAVVPVEETKLRQRLDGVAERAVFTAPEATQLIWGRLYVVLSDELPQVPATDWQARVGRIVRAEE